MCFCLNATMNSQTQKAKSPINSNISNITSIEENYIKSNFKNFSREAKLIRGEIIDSASKIENNIGNILSKLHKHTQYHQILKAIQPQLGVLISVLQKAKEIEFSLKPKFKKFEPFFKELEETVEIRNLMAHSKIRIILNEDLEYLLLISLNQFEKGVPKKHETTISLPELKRISNKIMVTSSKIEILTKDW